MKGKVVIVTGGSGLIGQAIRQDLVNKGATVLNADICVEDARETGTVRCDVTVESSVDEMIKKVMSWHGRIDGLVNNAYPRTEDWGAFFEDISPGSWKKNVDMQLGSTFYACQQVAAVMKEQRSGCIVNMGSIYGVVGNDFTVYEGTDGMTSPAAYAAIKGAVVNFTRYMASYLGAYNVRVNCVSPGGVFNDQHPDFVLQYEKRVPLRRMARPTDIAPAVSFLLSDGAAYITGHNLIVDGGWTAI